MLEEVLYETHVSNAHYMRSNLLIRPTGCGERHCRIILASPEMCLGDSRFAAFLKDPRWSRSIPFIVMDEAYCIKQWGGEFRKYYVPP